MTVSNVSSNVYTDLNGKSSTQTANEAGSADRFLKLLVAQMQNQDPLNPMDNAQVTSQMAQINTVTGVEKLNTSVQTLSSQFVQMQAVQSAALIGKDVVIPSNKMTVDPTTGTGTGGFEIGAAADAVKVEVLNAGGHVIDTFNLGAQSAGMHSFDWDAKTNAALTGMTFKVTATSGATKIDSTTLVQDKVNAVSTSGNDVVLETANNGNVAYGNVRSFN
jgi:flagellar basal-body rod modification protein FlgD